ncbi:unnamed protein product [Sphenostylis stenocarpa]|uniref:Uncharacterized protein n=1 Tax=Sphenostylis stenocarpa TaxID=92480 RepID=A0AA86VEL6_9FABA|nr:unnamed protein product [Sphenostylis stenocarpa]
MGAVVEAGCDWEWGVGLWRRSRWRMRMEVRWGLRWSRGEALQSEKMEARVLCKLGLQEESQRAGEGHRLGEREGEWAASWRWSNWFAENMGKADVDGTLVKKAQRLSRRWKGSCGVILEVERLESGGKPKLVVRVKGVVVRVEGGAARRKGDKVCVRWGS